MNDVLALTCELVSRASVTPEDAGCQALIAARLQAAGIHLRTSAPGPGRQPVGHPRQRRAGAGAAGPYRRGARRARWRRVTSDPFAPQVREGNLYRSGHRRHEGQRGRVRGRPPSSTWPRTPDHVGTLAVLVTSDEERRCHRWRAPCRQAVRRAWPAHRLVHHRRAVPRPRSWAICLRVGRRGSLTGTLVVKGRAGPCGLSAQEAPQTRSTRPQRRWPS